MNNKIFLSSPSMSGLEMAYIQDAFSTNWIAPLGPHVDGFEKEIAEYVGAKAATALTTGTAAIHLALVALNVGINDVVFCSSFTFSGSCNPILYQNAIPVFIDSEPESFNMSPKALEKAFEKHNPKAVIVVDLYGQSADMDKLKAICDAHNTPIIEDSAEALGTTYKGKMCGTFGKFGIISFNGNKIITTSGGGMLLSDDEDAIKKARFRSTQSRDKARYYQHTELGYNYRMSNICAAIGRGQLQVIQERIDQKKNIYMTYKEAFKDIDSIEMAPICDYGEPNYWLSVMTLKNSLVKPIDIILALEFNNIESRPVWKPMHLQPFFSTYNFYSHNDDGTSISEDLFNRGVCLPSDTKMTNEDMDRITGIIRDVFIDAQEREREIELEQMIAQELKKEA